MKLCISSGHGLKIRGASGILDEVDEARRVVEQLATDLRGYGIEVETYHDDVSTTQEENLNRIVDWHNAQPPHDLDISVHFNAYQPTDDPRGTEVLFITESDLARKIATTIADSSGLINRGAKLRDDLFFLNQTAMPAVLIEVCFVDSEADAEIYNINFDMICAGIAMLFGAGGALPEPETAGFYAIGTCSQFGGPDDTGVAPDEGLALVSEVNQAAQLFLPYQPEGTTGLARRLNPYIHYVACRWDYDVTSKERLLNGLALVRAVDSGRELTAFPADWGPHEDTGRVADLSPGLMVDLDLTTDDEVEVIFPAP